MLDEYFVPRRKGRKITKENKTKNINTNFCSYSTSESTLGQKL